MLLRAQAANFAALFRLREPCYGAGRVFRDDRYQGL